ncbi:MAG: hypothetical protein BGO49_03280 [Planctomycetales bacterium 71-10]|nr:MAG: hypothetical protein BGO49_03280 [Planctomycetales bacterium 71-10]
MSRGSQGEGPLEAAIDKLQRRARRMLARAGGAANSLGSWDLVAEALVKLLRDRHVRNHPDPAYVHQAGAEAMRRTLIDRFRAKLALKRGGRMRRVSLTEADSFAAREPHSTLHAWEFDRQDVRAAVARMEADGFVEATALRLHALEGHPVRDVAAHLGVSVSSVEKYLKYARTWVFRDLTRLARERRMPKAVAAMQRP